LFGVREPDGASDARVRFSTAGRDVPAILPPPFDAAGYSGVGVGEPHVDAIIADLERRLEASERAARALTDSERLYRSLFEGTATAVTLRSIDTQSFIDCNQAALRLYRARNIEQLRGSRVPDLSAEKQPDGTPSAEAFRGHVARAIETGFEHCEWLARRLDGTPFIADIRIAVLRLEDGRRIMQTIIEDITERKAAEALLQRRAERDEVIARISRRFLDVDLDDATRFAIDSLAAFFRVDANVIARWVETTGAPEAGEAETEDIALVRLTGEMIAMAKARRQAQDALRASEERYRTVVERSHDTIVIFDLEGRLTFVSPAGERLLGYPAAELLGMPLAALIAPEQHDRIPGTIADTRAGLVQSPTEWDAVRKDGTRVRLESVRSPIHDHAGKVVGGLAIARDVTERHRAEQTREETQRELARAKEDAIAASAAKSVFVANMSHELRTPLNGVIGMVDLLSRTPLDSRQKRYVEVARASASLLLSVINDILDFSKIEAGKLELEHVEFSLREVVEEVTTMLELSAEEKKLELSCTTDPALEGPCAGDPARVRQILVNLISNAIKFTPSGEVTVRAALEGESDGGRRVRIEVRDTGVGMTTEAQEKLFRPFSQVDASTTRQHGGTGLGLAICRQLVHRMGGEIGATSAPAQGSTFWFTLHFDPATGGERSAELDARLAGLRVLAVDDNATNREILRIQLVAAGMQCDAASSGEEALAMLSHAAARGEAYVLAILDQHMPGMDGCELARRIKADQRIAGTHLMMLGSMGRPLDSEQLQALGIAAWATKPVWRIKLLRALRSAIDGATTPSQGAVPVAQPARAAPEPATPDRPARVLLVEDTPINAEVVVEILRIAGYTTDVATDGLAALEVIRRAAYDVVLMDCQLPGIDGYETTRRIRSLEASGSLPSARAATAAPRVPILALTASATREDLERARLSGMDDHIAKPVDARRLLDVLAGHLGVRPSAPALVAAAAPANRVVDLARALDRVQGNRGLLGRMVAQFRAEAVEARTYLHEYLQKRAGDELGFAVHKLRGQALSLDAADLAATLGTLEGLVAQRDWAASERALREVDGEIATVLDALARK
jgi:PAS domain S-box-containing protein